MLLDLLALAGSLSTRGILAADEARSLAADVAEVVSQEEPFFDGPHAREKTARLLVIWAARESAGHVAILGDCVPGKKKTIETCASLGRLQTSRAWIVAMGSTPADVLSDGREAIRVGLRVMLRLRDVCKGTRGALRAYAGGTCVGTSDARRIVESRCKEAGC